MARDNILQLPATLAEKPASVSPTLLPGLKGSELNDSTQKSDSGCEASDEDESDSGYEGSVPSYEAFTPEGSNDDDSFSNETGTTAPITDHLAYYQHDDGVLTRPIRALYFHSRIVRRAVDKICDFAWNRRIEYNRHHGIDLPEVSDGWLGDEIEDEWEVMNARSPWAKACHRNGYGELDMAWDVSETGSEGTVSREKAYDW
ncbi:hypothetical protein K505DRAFT_327655 [Melanomma pulvis-pyrius CBS 109.77]|uniref:Uncharacterized protein n=1 Tax=Melanomma pulvis-pyrius CBS 109.77 TaxID=1314802 RepID=A0A6A6X267_9PLEO|nr:hypothetical protein K505DRAFT_327655 [Melanomma pulvis-pyrius CBS 109.77]